MTDIPNDISEALKANGLDEFFADCTGPHRREYLKWISEAKKPETRKKRVAQAITMLAAKRAEETAGAKKTKQG